MIWPSALIFLDQTAVVVGLRAIQRESNSSTVAVQWTISGYLLAFASLVAVSGRLAHLYGRRGPKRSARDSGEVVVGDLVSR